MLKSFPPPFSHDTLEDTDTIPKELEAAFGIKVRKFVEEVTDDKRLPKAKRKELQIAHAAQLSPDAVLLKLGDKISNVLDVTHSLPANWNIDQPAKLLVAFSSYPLCQEMICAR